MKIFGYKFELVDYLMLIFGVGNIAYAGVAVAQGAPFVSYVLQLFLGVLLVAMLTHQVYAKKPRLWKDRGKD